MRSPMGSRGAAWLWAFLDLNRPWVSLGENFKNHLVAGCLTSTEPDGVALATPQDRLRSSSVGPVWEPRRNFCPLIGLRPGL